MLSRGTVFAGRYRLEERVNSNGIGDIWRAVDVVIGHTVAVKVVPPVWLETSGFREWFRDGAHAMGRVDHPGIVGVIDYGLDESVGAYLVMYYVEGEPPWYKLAREGQLSAERTMAVVA